MSPTRITEFGFRAEEIAARFLESRGYKIIDHNYRKPWGEIDIIAEKESVLVFVEVKANSKVIPGFEPELRADWSKIKKIVRTARTYLADKKYADDQEWQIDIVSVALDRERGVAKIKHFKNIDV